MNGFYQDGYRRHWLQESAAKEDEDVRKAVEDAASDSGGRHD